MTDGRYTSGEHTITYKLMESLCYTPETKVTSCVNFINKYISKLEKNIGIGEGFSR